MTEDVFSELSGLCSAVDDGDLKVLHVLADWMEDREDTRSSGLRMFSNRQPEHTTVKMAVPLDAERNSVRQVETTWYFWTERTVGGLFGLLKGDVTCRDVEERLQTACDRRYYPSRSAAYLALASAFAEASVNV